MALTKLAGRKTTGGRSGRSPRRPPATKTETPETAADDTIGDQVEEAVDPKAHATGFEVTSVNLKPHEG